MKLNRRKGIILIIFAPILVIVLGLFILRLVYPFWIVPAPPQNRSSESTVFLTMEDSSLTRYGATFIYHNESDIDKITGFDFTLQIRVLGVWHNILITPPAWPALGFNIPANGTFEQAINWSGLYGSLPNGRFRLVTVVNPDIRLTYEFTIR